MCNAYNHPSNCTCGWGGEGHLGKKLGDSNNIEFAYFNKKKYSSYVNPNAKCPVCGACVYFYKSQDGGRVFFDDLGPPWPKHPCTDVNFTKIVELTSLNSGIRRWQKEGWVPIVVESNFKKSNFSYYLHRLDNKINPRLEIMNYDFDFAICTNDDVLNQAKQVGDSKVLISSYSVSKNTTHNFEMECNSIQLDKFFEKSTFKNFLV